MANVNILMPKVKKLAEKLVEESAKKGIKIIITQTLRTIAEQDALYAQGRTKPGKIVTNAKGGTSFHNYAVAFDFAPVVNGKIDWSAKNKSWGVVGEIGKKLGLEWGGSWKSFPDLPHFQYTAGYTIKDFQTKKVNYNKFN